MMFFLARSALCIGIVAAAAGGIGTGPVAEAIDRSARDAAEGVGRACLASSDCLRVGAAALSAAAGDARRGRAGEPAGSPATPRGSEAGSHGLSHAVPVGASGGSPGEPPPRRPEARSARKAAPAGG